MSNCNLINELFNINIYCCDSCHEDYDDFNMHMNEYGGAGTDRPFVMTCCAFGEFMEDLTDEEWKLLEEHLD